MTSGTKRRSTVLQQTRNSTRTYTTQYGSKDLISESNVWFVRKEIQQTASEGHPFYKMKRIKKPNSSRGEMVDVGGNFLSFKNQGFRTNLIHCTVKVGFAVYEYDGPFTAFYGATSPEFPFLAPYTDGQMDAMGTIAIAKVLPTNPSAGIGQFLGELRELPQLPGLALMKSRARKMSTARAVSSEYLNYQFGWVPFVKDLIGLVETVQKKDDIIAQYVRDSGRLVRRRTVLLSDTTTSNTTLSTNHPGSPAMVGPMYSKSDGTLTKSVTITRRVWFSGAFTYHLAGTGVNPGVKSKRKGDRFSFYPKQSEKETELKKRRRQILSKLYGLRLDPYLFYQLYPWSWLADWFTSLGSVVKNLVAFHNDGLVMKYGYIMAYTRETTTYTLSGISFSSGGPGTVTDTFVRHVKQRRKATPFGFGLNPAAFSPRQWSIIAALGISRAPKALKI